MIRFCIFILLLCAEVTIAYSSQSERPDSLPRSFTYSSVSNPLSQELEVQTITTAVPNVDSVESLERVLDSLGAIRPYRFGIEIPVNISSMTNGTLDELEDGSFIWRLKVICPGAKSINFSYTSTSLPRGSFLYAYNAERTSLEGPWYDRNTRSGKKLSTFPVQGNTVIIEAYIPRDKVNETVLELGKIIYGFRETEAVINPSLYKYKKESILIASCHKNVDCTEGNDWCREKYSVSRILLGGIGFCSGSLLNNVQENFTPYFLTAFHCVDDPSEPDGVLSQEEQDQVEDWSFMFGYIYHCGEPWGYQHHSYSGSVLRAAWNDTDFALLELGQQPVSGTPSFPDVYFNGWDRTGNLPTSATCLHHPGGGYMKISIDDDPLILWTWPGRPTNFHLRATFDVGTVEGGSSGAPLFDQNHRIVGQLHGRTGNTGDHCTQLTGDFGRFALSWAGGGTDETRLGNWLDPVNFDPGNLSSSQTALNGRKLDRLIYGTNYGPGTWTENAYDVMRIGSSTIGSGIISTWTVPSGRTINVKAGREIQVRGCAWIKSGAEARLSIGTIACSEVVSLSDNENDYMACTSGSAYQEPREKQTAQDSPTSNTPNHDIRIIPNPATDEIQILGTITASVELFSSVGLSVMTVEKGVRKVDVSQLTSGVYYARIPTVTGVVVKSFMIIR